MQGERRWGRSNMYHSLRENESVNKVTRPVKDTFNIVVIITVPKYSLTVIIINSLCILLLGTGFL